MSQSEMHAPDDLLALHAMGDPLPEAMGRHVAACRQCQTELDQWAAVIATARSTTAEDAPASPSPEVWQAGSPLELENGRQRLQTCPQPHGRRSCRPGRLDRSWAPAMVDQLARCCLRCRNRRRCGSHRRGRSSLSDSEPDPPPVAAPPVVASTSLAALPKHEGDGEAEIIKTPDGRRARRRRLRPDHGRGLLRGLADRPRDLPDGRARRPDRRRGSVPDP